MGIVLYQVDAFTSEPFGGNPAAVTLLSQPVPDTYMQAVAAEMNLSETAFLTPRGDSFGLRWFTPAAEVDLCGHATLASAHVLWTEGVVHPDARITFETLSGRLMAWKDGDRIMMDFPSEPAGEVEVPQALLDAVPARIVEGWRNRLDYMVVLDSEEAVRSLRPDMAAVASLGSRGMIVTALSHDAAYDFVSRYFAPQFGIPEDPVTGSAHCCLGPYWASRLDKPDLTGYQASTRGGVVHVAIRGNRVLIGGQAVSTARIEMLVQPD
jgi:predicted PhzF superfamily epimerase YddE/YHI9